MNQNYIKFTYNWSLNQTYFH